MPTPSGTVALHIPPGTSSGKRLRVKGHGVPAKDGRGRSFRRGADRPAGQHDRRRPRDDPRHRRPHAEQSAAELAVVRMSKSVIAVARNEPGHPLAGRKGRGNRGEHAVRLSPGYVPPADDQRCGQDGRPAIPPAYRITRGADFQRAYQRRLTAGDDRLLVFVFPNGLPHPRSGPFRLTQGRRCGGSQSLEALHPRGVPPRARAVALRSRFGRYPAAGCRARNGGTARVASKAGTTGSKEDLMEKS